MSETSSQPAEGEVIRLWRAWPWLLQLAIGLFVSIAAGTWLVLDPDLPAARKLLFWFEIILGGALALMAAVILALNAARNPRLILSQERLRYVRGPKAFVDVPYDEIEDVGVDKYGWLVRCIGIHLAHPAAPDGSPSSSPGSSPSSSPSSPSNAEKAVRFLQKRFGYDAVIPADLSARRIEEIVQLIRTRIEAEDNP